MTNLTDCILASGSLDTHGYGRKKLNGKHMGAHRFAYIQKYGAIPKGMQIDHLCRNRACINTNHLEVVTPRENFIRSSSPLVKNISKTHCVAGHEFNNENTKLSKLGQRRCIACAKEYHKKKAAERKIQRAKARG